MTALDGCFSTSGLGAEWACTIAIWHFTVYEEWKKRRQNRARMRSSSTKCTPTYRKESTRHVFPKFGEKIQNISGTVATANIVEFIV